VGLVDHMYLAAGPSRFEKVAVLQHKGANLAPWNLVNYTISTNGDHVRVDDQPLIFFHFHGLKHVGGWAYDPGLDVYRAKATTVIRRNVYAPYIRTLAQTARHLPRSIRGTAPRGLFRAPGVRRPRRPLELRRGILERRYVLVLNGWAL